MLGNDIEGSPESLPRISLKGRKILLHGMHLEYVWTAFPLIRSSINIAGITIEIETLGIYSLAGYSWSGIGFHFFGAQALSCFYPTT
jgi:hypothetical protein